MKNWAWAIVLLAFLFPAPLFAQTDTVNVLDFFDPGGGEGSLNLAVSAKISAGTLSNTVFQVEAVRSVCPQLHHHRPRGNEADDRCA